MGGGADRSEVALRQARSGSTGVRMECGERGEALVRGAG